MKGWNYQAKPGLENDKQTKKFLWYCLTSSICPLNTRLGPVMVRGVSDN